MVLEGLKTGEKFNKSKVFPQNLQFAFQRIAAETMGLCYRTQGIFDAITRIFIFELQENVYLIIKQLVISYSLL